VFEDRLISCRLWPERSPDLNPWDFYLWENQETKCIQIIATHWLNLRTILVKQLHLSRSVNWN
jgi:uncharacterized protein YbdZ (MbtH family)